MTLRAARNLTVYTAIKGLLQEHPDYPVRILCELGGISRSSYYKWDGHIHTEKEDFNEILRKELNSYMEHIPIWDTAGFGIPLHMTRESR